MKKTLICDVQIVTNETHVFVTHIYEVNRSMAERIRQNLFRRNVERALENFHDLKVIPHKGGRLCSHLTLKMSICHNGLHDILTMVHMTKYVHEQILCVMNAEDVLRNIDKDMEPLRSVEYVDQEISEADEEEDQCEGLVRVIQDCFKD